MTRRFLMLAVFSLLLAGCWPWPHPHHDRGMEGPGGGPAYDGGEGGSPPAQP